MSLEAWGWDSYWTEIWSKDPREEGDAPARVIQEHRTRWDIAGEDGPTPASLPPGRPRPAVGDWVAIRGEGPEGTARIVNILPRRTKFSRGAAGTDGREQIIAANVDTVWVTHGLDTALNLRRLERYLTLTWESGARPVVVLTKSDLIADVTEAERAIATIAPGMAVRIVSVHEPATLSALDVDLVRRQTVALLGPSGAGKSSLVNALMGSEVLRVGPVRERDAKGRHTTTRRELMPLPNGALLLDTPGMRELQLWDTSDGLDQAFRDISRLAGVCRFSDCGHDTEPGCAVKRAVEEGGLDGQRLESYLKLRREAERQRRRTDTLAREAEASRVKSLQKSLRAHLKRKYE